LGTLTVVKEEVKHVAEEIASDAASRAPVKTGTLKNSITTIPDPHVPDGYRVVMEWYGIFPEFGTVRQPAQPFMRPAADAHR
jgi:HK97 gp10 family phage protein